MFIASLSVYRKLSYNRSQALANVLQTLISKPDARVLDFGTGNMFLASVLASRFPQCSFHGIDIIQD